MNKRMIPWGLIAAVLVSVAAPGFARSAKKDLSVTFYEKRVQDLSSSGLTLAFVFKVINASSSPWYLTGYDYRVVVENAEYFNLRKELTPAISVSPSSPTLIALPVKITNANLFNAVPAAEGKDKLGCYLIGGMSFADDPRSEGDRVSVACSGEFPIYRDIQVVIRPLEVKDLTIGGGDMTFKAAVRNDNYFPVQVESLTYALELGGTKVSEGPLTGVTSVEAKSETAFALPLLLDFFELGNALYAALQKPPVACKFSGEVVIGTDWGRFRMSLEKKAALAVTAVR
jgi:LEA14-like dessication related protein